MSLYNILKGIGKNLNPNTRAGYGVIGKALVKEVKPENADGYAQKLLGMQLTTKAKVGLVGASLAVPMINKGFNVHNSASMGPVSAGEKLSGMTESVQLSPVIKRVQDGKDVKFRNSLVNSGADGDIVFSLHNMR